MESGGSNDIFETLVIISRHIALFRSESFVKTEIEINKRDWDCCSSIQIECVVRLLVQVLQQPWSALINTKILELICNVQVLKKAHLLYWDSVKIL